MPHFSLFTPLGHLHLTSAPSHGQRFFEAGQTSLGASYRSTPESREFAWLYAWAITLAAARYALEQAGKEWHPEHVYHLLTEMEAERGVVPRPGQSIGERRAELARRRKLPVPPSQTNVENALREVLGDAFVAYLPTSVSDAVNVPLALGDSPQVLARPDLPRRVARLVTPVATVGSSVLVTYEQFAEGVAWELAPRDVVVLEPESSDRAERVTITHTSDGDGAGPWTARFVPANAHPAGAAIVKQPHPFWVGTKRHALVLLAAEQALDPEVRRHANEILRRMARGVSTWDLAADNGDGATAGPFKVAVGMIGLTPIGLVTA